MQEQHEQDLQAFQKRLQGGKGIVLNSLSKISSVTGTTTASASANNEGGQSTAVSEPTTAIEAAVISKLQTGRDGLVQKMLVRQIVLSLVKSTSKAYTMEVLGLAAKVGVHVCLCCVMYRSGTYLCCFYHGFQNTDP